MSDGTWHWLKAASYFGLGAFAAWQGIKSAREATLGYAPGLPNDLLRSPPARDLLPGERERLGYANSVVEKGILKKSGIYTVHNIDERVAWIIRGIREDSLDPAVREAAVIYCSTKCGTRGNVRWCTTPKDALGEIKAIYYAVQQPASPIAVRYIKDHLIVDQFTAAGKTMKLRGEDCDGGCRLLGAMFRSIGYQNILRVMANLNREWVHIWNLVGVQTPNGTMWIPLDWSVYPFVPPGWQAPGADTSARTGRPAGIVGQIRDYRV